MSTLPALRWSTTTQTRRSVGLAAPQHSATLNSLQDQGVDKTTHRLVHHPPQAPTSSLSASVAEIRAGMEDSRGVFTPRSLICCLRSRLRTSLRLGLGVVLCPIFPVWVYRGGGGSDGVHEVCCCIRRYRDGMKRHTVYIHSSMLSTERFPALRSGMGQCEMCSRERSEQIHISCCLICGGNSTQAARVVRTRYLRSQSIYTEVLKFSLFSISNVHGWPTRHVAKTSRRQISRNVNLGVSLIGR
jgi:hypothetical protein